MTMRLMKLTVVMCATVLFSIAAMAQGSATADLSGVIKDPKGAMVVSATVTASNASKGIERTTTSNASGAYQILNLPPGDYAISASAPGFGKATRKNVNLTVGQSANLNFDLTLSANESVDVNAQVEAVDTHSSTTSRTIQGKEIENLPTNGRNYVNFTLLDPNIKRDSAPSIGAAPTSGVNMGGQRGRANLVNVDGMDAVDNSVNGIRSTVSQEAVQEFQVLTSNYNAEYGRASGGVINIVSKSGANGFHGNAFGYWRNNALDATNPFSTVDDPSYTRAQYGFTLGGALKKDKTFYFFSFEGTRRQETGFTSIGRDGFGLVPVDFSPCGAPVTLQVTQAQKDFFGAVGPGACPYIGAAGIASSNALQGNLGPLGGPTPPSLFITSGAPNPGSYIALNSLVGNYPISEKTDVYSIRLDHHINNNQSLVLRASVTPSRVTGIQVNGQNQVFGQNSFSRTSRQNFRDVNGIVGHTWAINDRTINEFRFQYAHRGLEFNPSSIGDTAGDTDTLPDGQGIAINMPGVAFFGREPFSFVHRTEDRYQFVDNFSWTHHNHNLKFGVDVNHLPLSADFTVNFGGLYNFGNVAATALSPFFAGAPSFSPVQAYGLGLPQVFVQGIGNPHDSFANNTLGLYVQDSWRIRPNFTLNYGLRYDVEYTPTFKPVNALSAAAQDKLGITQGIPRDTNNIAPRIGFAWDPWNDQKTVVRASYGLFYDHPLLALAFNSDITDGSQAPQLAFFGGSPIAPCSPTGSNLNAGTLFQGTFDGSCYPGGASQFGFLRNEQRFDAFKSDSVFVNQNYIANGVPLTVQPFGFPVAKNFQYAYSQQANLGFEHELTKDFVVSFNYNMNLGRHLNRPINANPVDTEALIVNWERALADNAFSGATLATNPLAVGSTGPAPCHVGPAGPWINASLVSFFRGTGGINPSSFAPLAAACAPIAALLGISNNQVPFSDMIANYSNGNSNYHGLTTTIKKRFSRKYEFQLAHTWSHAIDDSTDLQSLLAPQDSRFPSGERSRSTFDQRNRIVLSGVYQSGDIGERGSAKHAILSGWTVAPILEWSSGRPFNVLTGSDNNFDLSSNTDRPVEVSGAGVSACGDAAVPSVTSPTGWIQPACFIDSNPFDGVASGQLRGNLPRNAGTRPHTIFNDIRIGKRFNIGERMKLDGMMDVFNAWNRLNVADVNVIWTNAGQPTASFDPRQIQFGLKLSW